MANVPTDHKPEEVLARELHQAAEQVPVGVFYAHYKHPELPYKVFGHVIDEASDEVFVLYQAQYGKRISYTRALRIWLETVDWEGETVPRFTRLIDPPSIVASKPQTL